MEHTEELRPPYFGPEWLLRAGRRAEKTVILQIFAAFLRKRANILHFVAELFAYMDKK